jgi:NADPH:quinone reductase-like Zn-dependent oxidoreductase
MRAVVAEKMETKAGDFSTIDVKTIDVPKLEREQVLIRVNASSVNPVDWKVRPRSEQSPGLPLHSGEDRRAW